MACKKQELGPWQEAWLESLESGEHKQTTGYLTMFDNHYKVYQHCCLGVACEVLITNKVALDFIHEVDTEDDYSICSYDDQSQLLPNKAADILKFHTPEGKIKTPDNIYEFSKTRCDAFFKMSNEHASLAEMNDKGFTFKQIAKLIRRFPEAFFYEPA